MKNQLKKKLTKKQLELLPSSYDIIGSILIFSDFPKELVRKEKIIGEALLELHKNIKTVCKKTKKFSGKYRLPKLKIIAGEKTKETSYKENNVTLRLDVEKVYFSPRLSTERKRIYQLIKPKEDILVMFSGVAPYPLTISKNTQAKKIVGIEANRVAHQYAIENLKLNKIKNIELICGDVKKEIPKLKQKFDRIIMPLPKSAENFLYLAFKVAKKGTIIHLYQFLNKEEFDKAKKNIKNICKENKINHKFLNLMKCGQFSPGSYRVCLDFKITKL